MRKTKLSARLASVLVLLAACGGGDATTTEGSSSSGGSTDVEPTTTASPTTPTTTDPNPDTSSSTATASTGPDTTTDVDPSTSTTTTGSPDTDTATTTDTDADTGTTAADLCANGVIDPGEACDGTELAGEDCISQGFDSGELACAADCASFDASGCALVTCGDAMIQGNEVCDGDNLADQDCVSQGFLSGTLACTDGCAAFDTSQCLSCGNDVQDVGEACDGPDLAGEDCVSQGFANGTLACSAECIFDVSDCGSCGNDVVDNKDVCDGPDLDGKTCASLGGGNTGGTLKCSDVCAFDEFLCIAAFDEVEPNDDGTPSNASDFLAGAANGPFSKQMLIKAAITPIGDDDVFAFTNTTDGPVSLKAETFGPGGVGTCVATDTVLFIRNAAAVQLATDDESGINSCSLIDKFVLAPGETVYVQVIDFLDNGAIASYYLDVKMTPIVCGDSIIGPGEHCDDGNILNGDGCTSACLIEGSIAEIEPNNTNAAADATNLVSDGDDLYYGAISPIADLDRYRIDVAATQYIRFETFSVVNDCTLIDTELRLFDSNNTLLNVAADSDQAGIGSCSAAVFPLTAGTYYAEVSEWLNNALIPFYFFELVTLADQGMETEPNDTLATASTNLKTAGSDVYVFGDHSVVADVDWYSIDVPAGASLRLELIEGNRAIETCESNGVNSRLTLYNDAMVQLADDNDGGRGLCSLIDGTGNVPSYAGAHNLAAGTYYVQVRSSGVAPAAEFIYRLAATIRKP